MRARPGLALLLFCASVAVHADPLAVANRVRTHDCKPGAARIESLQEDPRVTAIAARWSAGGRLARALPESYSQARYVSLQMSGIRDEQALAAALRQQWCVALGDPAYTRFGAHRRGESYWIVLATGDAGAQLADADSVRATALRLVNAARAQQRRCGGRTFAPVPALRLSPALNRAAATHARNMAEHRKLQHEGFDGSTPGDRARAAGYAWRAVGENVAAGPTTAADVVTMWLKSPGHCANIMSPDYTEMGLAFAERRDRESGVYWAQSFGRPR